MIKSKLVKGIYGRVRIIDGFGPHKRLWIKRTNARTWVASDSPTLSLDSMVQINNEIHFGTLKELHAALNASHTKGADDDRSVRHWNAVMERMSQEGDLPV